MPGYHKKSGQMSRKLKKQKKTAASRRSAMARGRMGRRGKYA